MNRQFSTLEEKKKHHKELKTEWEQLKEQEKSLKDKFYNAPFAEKGQIKRELTSLQKTIFEKRDCGRSIKNDIEREESLQRRTNPASNLTDPKKLANLIKTDLRDILTNDSRWKKRMTYWLLRMRQRRKNIIYQRWRW